MKLYFFNPSYPKNLGKAYNDHMALLPSLNDWAVLSDQDTFFYNDPYQKIANHIEDNPNVGLFSCMTNRVGTLPQCINGEISNDFDIKSLRDKAIYYEQRNHRKCREIDHVISGHVMITSKQTWFEIGGFKEGILGVDNHYCEKVFSLKKRIMIMQDVVCFHYYRLHQNQLTPNHLI